jgi:transketolase
MITTGGMLGEAVTAAGLLAADGIECRVVSMHTLTPIDSAAVVDACETTAGIMTVEEHTIVGGLGGAVAEVCVDRGLAPRVFRRVGLRTGFSSIVGSQEYLRTRYGLDAASLRDTARAALESASAGAR